MNKASTMIDWVIIRVAYRLVVALSLLGVASSAAADSRVYISDATTVRVSDAATLEAIADLSGSLSTTGGFDDGRHLVADCSGRRFFVMKHGPDPSVFDFSVTPLSPTWPSLSEPLGMAALPGGKLLITDEERSRGLYRLKSNLTVDLQTPDSQLDTAEGVAYDGIHNRIFVADEDDDEIDIYNGSTLAHIDFAGTAFSSDGPYWLGADGSSNHLFVLGDSQRSSTWGIHVFDIISGGNDLSFNQTLLGSGGAGSDCFGALAVSEETDRVFAIDYCNDTVAIYNASTLSLIGTVSSARAGTAPLMVSTANCTISAPTLAPMSLWILALLLMLAGVVAIANRRFA